MSKLAPLDEPDLLERPIDHGPVLRRNRRRALHPETIRDLLVEKAKRSVVEIGPTPYGWKILLWEPNGAVHARHTSTRATYAEAKAIMIEEMATGAYEKGWLVRKTEPSK